MSRSPAQLAKLSRPRLHGAVPRRRLFRRIDELRADHPAVCIVGPPGAGKTTLVASWLEDGNLPGLWMQLDSGDADLASFFHYLGRGVRAFQRKNDTPLPALTPEYFNDLEHFTRHFFRILFEALPAAGVVVFDNYQEVSADSDLHRLIALAVEEVPPDMLLVVVSRRDPPDCYARLLANKRVVQIEWNDIRLSIDEAIEVGQARGIRDVDLVRRMHRRTEGWAAGLTLLLEHSHGIDEASGMQGSSHAAVFDYFTAEILARLAPAHQQMLLRAGLFPAVSADLACHISGQTDAGDVLEDLHRRHLFIDKRITGEVMRYQFHALFRDFLQRRLAAGIGGDELAALRSEAAALLDAREETREEALALYVEAGAWQAAVRITVALAPQFMSQGRWTAIRQWIDAIPELHRDDPWLGYWLGMALLNRDLEGARGALTRAFEGFGDRRVPVGQLLCAAAMIRSYHIEYANFQSMDRWVEAIDNMLREAPAFPSPSAELAVYGAVVLAVTYRLPAHPLGKPAVERVTALLHEPIDPNHRLPAALGLVLYHTFAHEFGAALAVTELMSPVSAAPAVTALNRAYWWLFAGYLHHRRRDRDAAEHAFLRTEEIVAEHGFAPVRFLLCCFRAYFLTGRHECVAAARAIEGLDDSALHGNAMQIAQYHFARFFIEMCRHNPPGAERHARLAAGAAERLGAPFFPVAWLSQGATALAYNGSYEDAQIWLDEAWRLSEGSFLETYRPMILASRAFIAIRRGEPQGARGLLREMIAQDRTGSGLLDAGWPVVATAIFGEALRAGIAVDQVRDLVRRMDLPGPEDHVPQWPWPVRISALGGFTVEVQGAPLAFSRKTPKKPIAMLKLLIALGPRAVSERKLIDALWAEEDGDAGCDALAVAMHRLRKLLRHREIVQHSEGQIALNRRYVWVDAWALDTLLEQRLADARTGEGDVDQVLELCRGEFLPADADQSWSILPRERLRGKLQRYLLQIGRRFEQEADLERARALYERGIENDALAEEFHQGIMRCLLGQQRYAEAMTVYRRLRQSLSITLGVTPSPTTQQLFQHIQQKALSVPDR